MAEVTAQGTWAYLGGFDLAPYLRSLRAQLGAARLDATTLVDTTERIVAGMTQLPIGLVGNWHEELEGLEDLREQGEVPLSLVRPADDVAYLARARLLDFEPFRARAGELQSWQASVRGSGAVARGAPLLHRVTGPASSAAWPAVLGDRLLLCVHATNVLSAWTWELRRADDTVAASGSLSARGGEAVELVADSTSYTFHATSGSGRLVACIGVIKE